jgi:hypothetical protein
MNCSYTGFSPTMSKRDPFASFRTSVTSVSSVRVSPSVARQLQVSQRFAPYRSPSLAVNASIFVRTFSSIRTSSGQPRS